MEIISKFDIIGIICWSFCRFVINFLFAFCLLLCFLSPAFMFFCLVCYLFPFSWLYFISFFMEKFFCIDHCILFQFYVYLFDFLSLSCFFFIFFCLLFFAASEFLFVFLILFFLANTFWRNIYFFHVTVYLHQRRVLFSLKNQFMGKCISSIFAASNSQELLTSSGDSNPIFWTASYTLRWIAFAACIFL